MKSKDTADVVIGLSNSNENFLSGFEIFCIFGLHLERNI
jgi:hypothetical protein